MKTWKILFIVIIVSIIGFGVFPLKKSIDSLKVENQKLSQEKKKKIAEHKELSGQNIEGKGILDPELEIPRKLEQTELLIDLQKIASQTNIQLPDSWSFSVVKDSDLDISELGISFPIKGSRGDIYKFIQLVEKNKRLLKIERLAISTFYENNILVSEMTVNLQAFSQENIDK